MKSEIKFFVTNICLTLISLIMFFFVFFFNLDSIVFFIIGPIIAIISIVFSSITISNINKGKLEVSKSIGILLLIISILVLIVPLIWMIVDISINGLDLFV